MAFLGEGEEGILTAYINGENGSRANKREGDFYIRR
jgi:hypothetical protein